jgi:hypothetical protein
MYVEELNTKFISRRPRYTFHAQSAQDRTPLMRHNERGNECSKNNEEDSDHNLDGPRLGRPNQCKQSTNEKYKSEPHRQKRHFNPIADPLINEWRLAWNDGNGTAMFVVLPAFLQENSLLGIEHLEPTGGKEAKGCTDDVCY